MHNFEKFYDAAPAAREGILTLNGKSNRTPTHLTNLTRATDPDRVVDTIRELIHNGEDPLVHIGGFVIESQLVPTVLGNLDRSSQTDLTGETKFSNIYSVMDKLERWQIIDPNTDRIFYSAYRNHLSDIHDYIPDGLMEIAEARDRDEDDPGEELDHDEVYHELKRRVDANELVDGFVSLQIDQETDIILPPYVPIDLDTYETDIDTNRKLYSYTKQISDSTNRPIAAVIPLKNSVISADSERSNGRRQRPQAWIDIIQKTRELEPDVLFLKATNFPMDPNKLNKREYEGIFHFFRLLRRFSNRPVLFLGLDEFAYILMAEGLDGYSQPLYKSSYRTPVRAQPNVGSHSLHRKFIVPRKWGWKKFDQLDTLGCNCIFCHEYNDVHPSQIELGDQDQLRNQHWLKLRDEELREMHEAIRRDLVRPGLQSICGDSEWKKNFTTFL